MSNEFHECLASCGYGRKVSVDMSDVVTSFNVSYCRNSFKPLGSRHQYKVLVTPAFVKVCEFLKPAVPERQDPVKTVESRRIRT
ncbi:hypothetical protein CCR75_006116 [Bremia lactucae]|uniref:Uncharacterized protein n=1 Tax=Bremia lactucae TaxID=4779 RepID=A0A976II12_BRELC|nr:hypothetical protein CCR75_006116 [Bremia lactucae]